MHSYNLRPRKVINYAENEEEVNVEEVNVKELNVKELKVNYETCEVKVLIGKFNDVLGERVGETNRIEYVMRSMKYGMIMYKRNICGRFNVIFARKLEEFLLSKKIIGKNREMVMKWKCDMLWYDMFRESVM